MILRPPTGQGMTRMDLRLGHAGNAPAASDSSSEPRSGAPRLARGGGAPNSARQPISARGMPGRVVPGVCDRLSHRATLPGLRSGLLTTLGFRLAVLAPGLVHRARRALLGLAFETPRSSWLSLDVLVLTLALLTSLTPRGIFSSPEELACSLQSSLASLFLADAESDRLAGDGTDALAGNVACFATNSVTANLEVTGALQLGAQGARHVWLRLLRQGSLHDSANQIVEPVVRLPSVVTASGSPICRYFPPCRRSSPAASTTRMPS